ncbi:MAG: dockerin type I domain-containing protein [Phycisphaerae bacterium]|nr:dockerin type I domain-containing protein [Phycisphaerae bacterium]
MARNQPVRAGLGILASVSTFAAALVAASPAWAQCRYTATPIENYPCADPSDGQYFELAINSSATWVGYRRACPPDYLLEVASIGGPKEPGTNLPVLQYGDAKAYDVNDDGVAVGYVWPLVQQAVVWMPDGEVVVLPLQPRDAWSSAFAVNNFLQVVGVHATVDDKWFGFVWQDGVFHDIDPGRWNYCNATGISDSGIVTGYFGYSFIPQGSVGFRWVNGVIEELPPARGGVSSEGTVVNNDGLVAGRTLLHLPQWTHIAARPTIWKGSIPQELPSHPYFRQTNPQSINSHGIIVGIGYDYGSIGEIWVNGQLIDLADLVDVSGRFYIENAVSMNDSGQILVRANGGKSYILNPIDPPDEDLTGDCSVDAKDVAFVMSHWRERNSSADLNGDGEVSAIDLGILLGASTSLDKR